MVAADIAGRHQSHRILQALLGKSPFKQFQGIHPQGKVGIAQLQPSHRIRFGPRRDD